MIIVKSIDTRIVHADSFTDCFKKLKARKKHRRVISWKRLELGVYQVKFEARVH